MNAPPKPPANTAPKNRWRRRIVKIGLGALVVVGVLYFIYGGGRHEGPGVVHKGRLPPALVRDRAARQEAARPKERASSQILFGDLHVHTTFSTDAFMRTLPLLGGEGAHPPADACDYARYCSSLDFFALTDHAEALTPQHWQESKESIRQCNAAAGDPQNPDIVAYIGWEWSQVGRTPETHYGHKNVIFRKTADADVPSRPIAAAGLIQGAFMNGAGLGLPTLVSIPIREFSRRQRYLDTVRFFEETTEVPDCPSGVDVRALPVTCRETAAKPSELFEKLAQWGMESLVIPHGTTWGFYTPPGYTYDKQISPSQDDPERQRLIEIYSGHGNSEEYRPFHEIEQSASGEPVCPEPTKDYEPCCYRAGEIIRSRCGSEPKEECEKKVALARQRYAAAGVAGHLTVPGATVEDWKGCGVCRDCFNPSYQYRPRGSAQYLLAQGNFDDPERPAHIKLGFIASSDNHSARPGTGYKEYARRANTEATGACDEEWRERIFGEQPAPVPDSKEITQEVITKMPPFRLVDLERQASFFMTGGLVAVHSPGRDRDAIFDALKRREVYGTSGERILLWFDRITGPGAPAPMGSEAKMGEIPRFRVRAAGSFVQLPGCPDFGDGGLPASEIQRICLGECYHPGDARRLITRVEVVRIRPRRTKAEPLDPLIQDPWKRFDCPKDPAGCTIEFSDDEFVSSARDALYYVRAIQEPTPAVNAGNVRCVTDGEGRCVKANPCYGDYRTSTSDDCLTPNEERAWSSPIFLSYAPIQEGASAPPAGEAR